MSSKAIDISWIVPMKQEVVTLRAEVACLRAAWTEESKLADASKEISIQIAGEKLGLWIKLWKARKLRKRIQAERDAARAALAEKEDECGRWSAAFEEARVRQNQTTAERDDAIRDREKWGAELGRVRLERTRLLDERDAARAELARLPTKEMLKELALACAEGQEKLRAELAAVAGERDAAIARADRLAALLCEVPRIFNADAEDDESCHWCGGNIVEDDHAPECWVTRRDAALAAAGAQEGE